MSPDQEQLIIQLLFEVNVKFRAYQEAQDKLDLALLRVGNPKFKLKLVEPEKPPIPADILDGKHASEFTPPGAPEKPLTPQPQTEEKHGVPISAD